MMRVQDSSITPMNNIKPKVGDFVNSAYFGGQLLKIVKIVNDNHWYFILGINQTQPLKPRRAKTPLSYFIKNGLYKIASIR